MSLKRILKEDVNVVLEKIDSEEEYYSIEEEYGITSTKKLNEFFVNQCKESIDRFKETIDLFENIKIVFVTNIGDEDTLGRFRSGTSSSTPIIMLSEENIIQASEEMDVPLWVGIETTLFHELGHAICELEYDVYGYEHLEYGDEEEWVEDFAYQLHEYGTIPDDLENFIQAYKNE